MILSLTGDTQLIPNLDDGTIYLIQNRSGCALAIEPAASAPTTTDGAYLVGPMGQMEIQREAGIQYYVTAVGYSSVGEIGHIIYHRAPQ